MAIHSFGVQLPGGAAPRGVLLAPDDAAGGPGAGGGAEGTPAAGGDPSGGGRNDGGNPEARPGAKSGDGAADGGTDKGEQRAKDPDRSNWVHPDHFGRIKTKADRLESEFGTLKSEHQKLQKGLKLALGIDDPDSTETEKAELRNTLGDLIGVPVDELKKLSPQGIQSMIREALVAERQEREVATQAESTIKTVNERIAKRIGIEKLSERQARRVRAMFADAAEAAWQARPIRTGTDPETGQQFQYREDNPKDFFGRYSANDPTLIDEFVNEIAADFGEPVRRQDTLGLTRRLRPVPSGDRTRHILGQGEKKRDLTNRDEFKEAMLEARRERLGA